MHSRDETVFVALKDLCVFVSELITITSGVTINPYCMFTPCQEVFLSSVHVSTSFLTALPHKRETKAVTFHFIEQYGLER